MLEQEPFDFAIAGEIVHRALAAPHPSQGTEALAWLNPASGLEWLVDRVRVAPGTKLYAHPPVSADAGKGVGRATECRHCGWLCMPNNDKSRDWYPLSAPSESVAVSGEVSDSDIDKIGRQFYENCYTPADRQFARAVYDLLDSLILAAVEQEKHPLYERRCFAEASRIAKATGREDFRVIDGRIQALRKAGKIRADRKTRSWRLA